MIYHHHIPPHLTPSAPESGITEVPGWNEPTRIIVLTTSDGVRQWRCEGLASNVTPEGLRALADLLEQAEERVRLDASETALALRAPVGA